jgi:prepilin-type N-terminal cleavage/methylation domain-containing protein
MNMAPWHCELVERTHRRGVESAAFTLIELFVVMAVVGILLGLAFPAFTSVQNSARKTQAKNDLVQIVTAVNAFYTEYGKYPITGTTDTTFGPGGTPPTNQTLINPLRGLDTNLNPRQIVFLSPPEVKDSSNPRGGVVTKTSALTLGQFFDPWGTNYVTRIDGDYDNQLPNPYNADTGGGSASIRRGVIAWSLGNNKTGGNGPKSSTAATDDVISWQ